LPLPLRVGLQSLSLVLGGDLLRKTLFLLLCVWGLVISCSRQDSTPAVAPGGTSAASASAGAHVEKPFLLEVRGADCYSGKGKNSGDVAFGFPNRTADIGLQFTIGPLRDGLSPGQENNKPYSGPGDYANVGIVIKRAGQKPVLGYGNITVNSDEQSGTFRLPQGAASGSWDCGHKLER